jgi:hypothetical protein
MVEANAVVGKPMSMQLNQSNEDWKQVDKRSLEVYPENQFLFAFQQIQGWNMSMSPFPPKSPFNATNYACDKMWDDGSQEVLKFYK